MHRRNRATSSSMSLTTRGSPGPFRLVMCQLKTILLKGDRDDDPAADSTHTGAALRRRGSVFREATDRDARPDPVPHQAAPTRHVTALLNAQMKSNRPRSDK